MTTTTDQRRRHQAQGSLLAAAGLALGVVLTGCTPDTRPVTSTTTSTSTRGASTATGGAASATTAGAERDIVLAGRHFRARCDGSGPAVIAVADYGRSMDDMGRFLQDLAPHAQVCLYDRLGVGRSDSAPHVQTFDSLADDLDGVISGLGLTRPVVVLGDALGAPIALSWVSRHEKDARAVLLTMPTPPGFMGPRGALSSLLPPNDPGDLELSNLKADLERFDDPALNRESLDPRSWDAYLRLPPTSTPLYDLVGAPTLPWPASVDAKKVNAAWQQGQNRVMKLSSASHLVTIARQADWPAAIERALEGALQS
jgi:pimeloyl-ACP methyl ester carboxylesterase